LGVARLVAGEYLLYKYGAPLAVDWLMKPANVADMNILFKAASKVPENAVDDKKFRQAPNNIKKTSSSH
jgi:hypothetical protein